MKRKAEWKMRRIQEIRTKPQRSVEPKPAREMRRQNRLYTGRG